ncbi:Serine/threonine-protein kinase 4 [Phlyctochytrium planicorne]|nr:Serine/threonine-protein kinase 4 [Phlyctochytrium planicorne]
MELYRLSKKHPQLFRTAIPLSGVEILEPIGRGTYGSVHKGTLKSNNSAIAIKMISLEEWDMEGIIRELDILKICSNPNIVAFKGHGIKDLNLMLFMEYCDGGSLHSILHALGKSLSEEQISCVMFEMALGLSYLHGKGIIHRDIKAGNILLTADGQIKISDFGISAKLRSSNSRTMTFIGTPYWMAPEVLLCDPSITPLSTSAPSYDYKADIWSIGITAIELAEGKPPYLDVHPNQAVEMILKAERAETILKRPDRWSREFQQFIWDCLSKDPASRPSCKQLLKHPFLARASSWPRRQIIGDLVLLAKQPTTRNNQTSFDDDEGDAVEVENAANVSPISPITLQSPTPISPEEKQPQFCRCDTIPTSSTLSMEDKPLNAVVNSTALGALSDSVLSADVLDERFVLIGQERGLFALDTLTPSKPLIPLIENTRFLKIQILKEYNVMVAIAGRNNHIRQYRLESIHRLVNLQSPARKRRSRALSWNIQATENFLQKLHLMSPKEENDPTEEEARRLEEDYLKIVDTKDCKSLVVQRTEISIYLAAIFRKSVVLFNWALEPYQKFMKVQTFAVPEMPNLVRLLHDGISITEIALLYRSDASIVDNATLQVMNLRVSSKFRKSVVDEDDPLRWRSFEQIPFLQSYRDTVKSLVRPNMLTLGRPAHIPESTSIQTPEKFAMGTYHSVSYIIDMKGNVITGAGVGGWSNGVIWNEPPLELILRPPKYVLAVTEHFVQAADWRTANILQTFRVAGGARLRMVRDESEEDAVTLILSESKEGNVLYMLGGENENLVLQPVLNSDSDETATIRDEKSSSDLFEAANSLPVGEPGYTARGWTVRKVQPRHDSGDLGEETTFDEPESQHSTMSQPISVTSMTPIVLVQEYTEEEELEGFGGSGDEDKLPTPVNATEFEDIVPPPRRHSLSYSDQDDFMPLVLPPILGAPKAPKRIASLSALKQHHSLINGAGRQ